MSSTALIGVHDKDAGVASALVNATQQVGGALGTALLNTVAATATASYLASHAHSLAATSLSAVHGYTTAFSLSAALMLLAAIVVAIFIRASREELESEHIEFASVGGLDTAATTG
jgi:sugar phosphate permease